MDVTITGLHIIGPQDTSDIGCIIDAVRKALDETTSRRDQKELEHAGLFVATTFSNFKIRKDNASMYYDKGVRVLNPADFPKCLISYLGGCVCTALRLKGVNSTVSSGRSSGIDALTQALYFLKRNAVSKAVIVELDEVPTPRATISLGGACIIIENTRSAKQSYADILGVESFFEKKGQARALGRAFTSALGKLPIPVVDGILCAVAGPGQAVDARSALSVFPDASKIAYSERSSICEMARILKPRKFSGGAGARPVVTMFLNLGEDTNSNCVTVRSLKRKENTCERKKQQRQSGKKRKEQKTR